MATFIFPRVQVNLAGLATEATQLLVLAELVSVNSELDSQTALLTTIDADTGNIVTSAASIDTKLTTTNSELVSVNTELDTITSELVSVNSELDNQTTLLTNIDTDTSNIVTSTSSIDTKLTTTNTELAAINAELDTQTVHLSQIETAVEAIQAAQELTVVDFIDSTPLLDVSSSNIPASSSAPLQLVASLAAPIKKIQSVEDIGEFIGIYTGAPASEVLLCILPLGGGEVPVEVPAGTRISVRHMKNSAITSGFFAINFLG